jgi:hypothetical protein
MDIGLWGPPKPSPTNVKRFSLAKHYQLPTWIAITPATTARRPVRVRQPVAHDRTACGRAPPPLLAVVRGMERSHRRTPAATAGSRGSLQGNMRTEKIRFYAGRLLPLAIGGVSVACSGFDQSAGVQAQTPRPAPIVFQDAPLTCPSGMQPAVTHEGSPPGWQCLSACATGHYYFTMRGDESRPECVPTCPEGYDTSHISQPLTSGFVPVFIQKMEQECQRQVRPRALHCRPASDEARQAESAAEHSNDGFAECMTKAQERNYESSRARAADADAAQENRRKQHPGAACMADCSDAARRCVIDCNRTNHTPVCLARCQQEADQCTPNCRGLRP